MMRIKSPAADRSGVAFPAEPNRYVRQGDGVPQDYVRAHMWFSLSAAQGEQRAVKFPEIAERRMTSAQITEAQKLARDCKPATRPPPR